MANLVQAFKLSNESRPTKQPPVVHRRNKLITRINEQIQAARSHQDGQRLSLPITRRIRNKETGETADVVQQRRVRQDWWVAQSGKVCFELKYGTKRIELAKGKCVIEVGDKAELIPTLERLIAAVDSGELDQQIAESVGAFGREIPKTAGKKS